MAQRGEAVSWVCPECALHTTQIYVGRGEHTCMGCGLTFNRKQSEVAEAIHYGIVVEYKGGQFVASCESIRKAFIGDPLIDAEENALMAATLLATEIFNVPPGHHLELKHVASPLPKYLYIPSVKQNT